MKRFIFVLPLMLDACVVGRDYETPKMSVPEKWSEETAVQKNTGQWWEIFNDSIKYLPIKP